MLFYRKVTILMVGLDNAGKTSTVADLTGGSFTTNFIIFLSIAFDSEEVNILTLPKYTNKS